MTATTSSPPTSSPSLTNAAPDRVPGIDYAELSATDLAKLINDEYGMVLAAEYRTFQRAQAIGEMLLALRKGAKHGEWKAKLGKWCPKLSYETANRYTKLWDNREEITKAATAKNVKMTDLTIDAALKLLAKPKPDNGNASKVGKAGVDPPATKKAEDVGKEWLRALAPDELVIILNEIHRSNTEYLQELSAGLGKVLRPPPSNPIGAGLERRI